MTSAVELSAVFGAPIFSQIGRCEYITGKEKESQDQYQVLAWAAPLSNLVSLGQTKLCDSQYTHTSRPTHRRRLRSSTVKCVFVLFPTLQCQKYQSNLEAKPEDVEMPRTKEKKEILRLHGSNSAVLENGKTSSSISPSFFFLPLFFSEKQTQ